MSNRRAPLVPWAVAGPPGTRIGVKGFPRKENRRRLQMRRRRENCERLFGNETTSPEQSLRNSFGGDSLLDTDKGLRN